MGFPAATSRPLADTLNLRVAVLLSVVAAISLSLSWVLSGMQLRKDIQMQTRAVAVQFAISLREPVWNLDTSAIHSIMAEQVLPENFPFLRVTDQFGGVLYQRGHIPRQTGSRSLMSRHRVIHQKEIIGWVEVWGNTERLAALRMEIMGWITVNTVLSLAIVHIATRRIVGILISQPLGELAEKLGGIAAGECPSPMPAARSPEIEIINREILNMAGQIAERTGQLETLRDHLEKLVEDRTAALEESNRALAEQVERRKEAQRRLLTVSSMERRRIGRDLHDTLGQQLTGINFIASSLASQLDKESSQSAECARRVALLVQEALTQNRLIARGLVGSEMSGDSLVNEIERLAADTGRLYHVDCHFALHGDLLKIHDPEVGMHLYRIIQEALHNAIRHGRADTIEIDISTTPGDVVLAVRDDGVGISETECRAGMGMTTMSYRAEMLGGTFHIGNREEGGTEIKILLPNPPEIEGGIA